MSLITQFKAARRVSTPIIAIRTADPAATIQAISLSFNGNVPPVVTWDAVRGLAGYNEEGRRAVMLVAGDNAGLQTVNPIEALSIALNLPAGVLVFVHNGHRVIAEGGITAIQAIWNCRDEYKANRRTLVLLCPSIDLPAELSSDVLVFDEPLPDNAALAEIVAAQYTAAQLPAPDEQTIARAVDATCGLAAFPAEQVTAMSLTREGLDLGALWERKRQTIEQTPGLSVWRGGERFSDIGGVENVKTFLGRVLKGEEPPRAVVFIDEIEKALSGAGGSGVGDTSGVSQSMLGTLLTWMQDNNATGMIAVGPPGSAKSMIAKATGAEGGIPTIQFDLTGMKGSLVGQSEQNLRNALKVVSAVSQGRTLFIATCNSLAALPPELRRRFTFGVFFFDLPSPEERRQIWNIYKKRYSVKGELPIDDGWTGAEIKQACELAYRLRCSLKEAATYIVPVALSSAEMIEKLRTQASGRFISASHAGVYRYNRTAAAAPAGMRAIETE